MTSFAYKGAADGGRLDTATRAGATTTYGFDDRERRTSEVSVDSSRTLAWNDADRLSSIKIDRGRNGSIDVTATFAYDASGQRTRSVVTSAGVTTTTDYTWDGILLTRAESVCGTQTTGFTYLYDELSRPIAIAASLPGTTTPYLLPFAINDRGDVGGIVDSTGTVAAWTYTPYGELTSTFSGGRPSVPASVAEKLAAQPIRYAGYLYDEFSGYYYCSQRYYDPVACQFLTRDPAGADAEESAYQYCAGDPVGKTDPSGLWAYRTYARHRLTFDEAREWSGQRLPPPCSLQSARFHKPGRGSPVWRQPPCGHTTIAAGSTGRRATSWTGSTQVLLSSIEGGHLPRAIGSRTPFASDCGRGVLVGSSTHSNRQWRKRT